MIDVAQSHIFHRKIRGQYPLAVRASGMRIIDAHGKHYIDGVSGASVCSLGYGDPDVVDAVRRQVESLAFVHSASFANPAAEALADKLIGRAPGDFSKVYFVSGGSEAIETALKIARQYAVLSGRDRARLFVSRANSYHGNTLGALGVGGSPGRRSLYEPLLAPKVTAPRCYAFRDQQQGEGEDGYAARLLSETAGAIEAAGPENIVAVIAEPVVGTALGAATAPRGYFRGLRSICDRYGLLLILDEVMCGVGRTGSFFAYEQDDVRPDILVMAKGLGAGYQPIGATLITQDVFDTFDAAGESFQHGHTYIGHATACAAGLAVIEKIEREKLLVRVQHRAAYMFDRLAERLGQTPYVADIRGRGLFAAVELVADRDAKTPFAAERRIAQRLKDETMAQGLVCYPIGGFIDGALGDHVMLAPAFIATEPDIDEIIDKLALSISRVVEASA